MRETRSSGSVEGVMSNRDPYSDYWNLALKCFLSSKTGTRAKNRHGESEIDENQHYCLITRQIVWAWTLGNWVV